MCRPSLHALPRQTTTPSPPLRLTRSRVRACANKFPDSQIEEGGRGPDQTELDTSSQSLVENAAWHAR